MYVTLPRRAAPVAFLLTLLAGCGGDGTVTPSGGSSLSAVTVTPTSASLYTLAPGNTQALDAVARDNGGADISSSVTMSFTSDAPSIATVSTGGLVTAVAAGTAHITASAASGGTTKTAAATITVIAAPASAVVTAPALIFTPSTVNVAAGGSISWNIGDVHHSIVFETAGSPSDIGELLNASEARVFPTSGTYAYHCGIHPSMHGTVRVH